MKRRFVRWCCVSTLALAPLCAQGRVDSRNLYERVYAIVPMTGSGTWADPKRPMFAPPPSQMRPDDRTGIIAFHHELSDDGKFALVEFVAPTKTALAPTLAQLRQGAAISGVRIFERGKSTRAELEAAFKAAKKNFDFEKFQMVTP